MVAALAAAPLAGSAATARLPHDLTFPVSRAASVARGSLRTNIATQSDVGSANTATADPPVARPNEAPCVDVLFTNFIFENFSGNLFDYAPPAGCPGPYAKIVFNGNFAVSAGIQFDRTASVQIGNVPLYFGTTVEPNTTLAPSWHVERDVTDDAALLAVKQSGEADIFNLVNSQFTGVITGTAFLQFYPARGSFLAAATPDIVLPLPRTTPGGPQHLPTGASLLTAIYKLPPNVDRAYLDVYAQSQQEDEQWFLCAPSDVASELFACPNSALRETEITIDGRPAGVAPVYPWIFTGGLDPFLWAPIPGVQTLDFVPFRVDLTPFAALLDDGKAHTFAMSVDNADQYFQGFATLLAFRDRGSRLVTGGLTRDTLAAAPVADISENLAGTSPSIDGTIDLTSARSYDIDGFVNTSKGRVVTSLHSELDFGNHQVYSNESATTGTLKVLQSTVDDTIVTTAGGPLAGQVQRAFSYPLAVKLDVVLDDTGTGTQVGTIDQRFFEATFATGANGPFQSFVENEVAPTDTLDILDDEFITGNSNQSSTQRYVSFDTQGGCYTQTVKAANNLVSSVTPPTCDRSAIARAFASMMGR